jgi:hypothetical protein
MRSVQPLTVKGASPNRMLDEPEAVTVNCVPANTPRFSGTVTSTPLNLPAALAVVRPISVVLILMTTVSPAWNPSPLTLNWLPAGPLVLERKMLVSATGGIGGIVKFGTGAFVGTGRGAVV